MIYFQYKLFTFHSVPSIQHVHSISPLVPLDSIIYKKANAISNSINPAILLRATVSFLNFNEGCNYRKEFKSISLLKWTVKSPCMFTFNFVINVLTV